MFLPTMETVLASQVASAKLAPWGLFLQLSVNVGVGIVDRYKIRYENLDFVRSEGTYIKAIRVNKLQCLCPYYTSHQS